ncbi:hypothetical protein Fcan01_28493 [Folsomia candida]|uniref:Uncharacterized protein n=1 Tax=Folsomia candida TaxID=158441 RepID=A0A226CW44_FOLCA|nr:hypothetical protein Fcan01_28493 [Folsomia candida]
MKDLGENILDLSEFYDPDLISCAELELHTVSLSGEDLEIVVSTIFVIDGPKLFDQLQVAAWNYWELVRRDLKIQEGKQLVVLTRFDLDDQTVVVLPKEEVTLYKSGTKDIIVTDVLAGGEFTLIIEGQDYEVENVESERLFTLKMLNGKMVEISEKEVSNLPDITEAMTGFYLQVGFISLALIIIVLALSFPIAWVTMKKVQKFRRKRVVKNNGNVRHIYTAVDYGVN